MIAENLEAVKKYFGDDMNASRLSNQLAVLSEAISDVIENIGVREGILLGGRKKFALKITICPKNT